MSNTLSICSILRALNESVYSKPNRKICALFLTFFRLSLKICEGLFFDYEPRIRCQARHPPSEKYNQIHKMQLTGKRIKDKISPNGVNGAEKTQASPEFCPYIALFHEKIALPLGVTA